MLGLSIIKTTLWYEQYNTARNPRNKEEEGPSELNTWFFLVPKEVVSELYEGVWMGHTSPNNTQNMTGTCMSKGEHLRAMLTLKQKLVEGRVVTTRFIGGDYSYIPVDNDD